MNTSNQQLTVVELRTSLLACWNLVCGFLQPVLVAPSVKQASDNATTFSAWTRHWKKTFFEIISNNVQRTDIDNYYYLCVTYWKSFSIIISNMLLFCTRYRVMMLSNSQGFSQRVSFGTNKFMNLCMFMHW